MPGGSKTAALTYPAPWPGCPAGCSAGPSPLRAFPMSLQQRCLASSPWLSEPAQKLPLKGLTWNLYTPLPPFSLLRATTDQPTLKRRANRLCASSSVQFSSVAQSCPTLCDPMDCSLPGSSVHGILQASVLEWVAISFSRGSSQPGGRTQVSRTAGRRFTV